MNLAELSIRKSLISWVMMVLILVVGWQSYQSLSRLEDPEFTIKEAVILTPYPGASAAEVEEEVTNVLEKAIQQMGQLQWIESNSSRGLSWIKAHIEDKYDKFSLPQVWDELRRKVRDARRQLPPGAGEPLVNDDFGDVYGMYYAITGEGYTPKELYEYAKVLQRELLKATDVKRVTLYGYRKETIYVEMRREQMAKLGVAPQDIYRALGDKNLVADAGSMKLGQEYIPINPTGEFRSEQDFGDLLITPRTRKSNRLIYLRDVATIRRGYEDPPTALVRYNGKPAIAMGISTVLGGNVITMAKSLDERLRELEPLRPAGVEIHYISNQAESVTTALSGFMINLIEAVAIVIAILLLFMGVRSGLIIGFILLLTIMGTFVLMGAKNVTLERISLGALIIALGMLVDNAIVVADGIRVRMQKGMSGYDAACGVVAQNAIPMLGGTAVAITAFAAIGTSQDSTGEYCRSLFTVILFSLSFSWLTAVTFTPLLCSVFLKAPKKSGREDKDGGDIYDKGFYALYKKFLSFCIRFRWVVVAVVVLVFGGSMVGFQSVKKSFFPDSTRPQFYIDFWFPEGTDIYETDRQLRRAEAYLRKDYKDVVTNIATQVGGGQVRFLLTYTPESQYANYGQLLADVSDYRKIASMAPKVQEDLEKLFPDALVNVRLFVLGPSTGGKIQLRILGPDRTEIRRLMEKARDILLKEPTAKSVRNEWMEMSKVLRPELAEAQARRAGIDRPDVAKALQANFDGVPVGVYREADELIPILARAPERDRLDMDSLKSIPIWSPAAQEMIPLGQVVSSFPMKFEDAHVWRRDRRTMIRLHADPRVGLPSELFAKVKAPVEKALGVDIEQILGRPVPDDKWTADTLKVTDNALWPLKGKPGYYMAWGGEAEDSARAGANLARSMPVFFGLMMLIVLLLFNSIKKTLIIWFTVPLAVIGVTVGLLAFHQPFGFMALLGLMSLSGMLIKSSIILIDELETQLKKGVPPFQAVINAGVSRLIPVSMSSSTTMLGMIPLFKDAFFISMAVTIVFGLGFATVLILIVVPVLYAIFFRVKKGDSKPEAAS